MSLHGRTHLLLWGVPTRLVVQRYVCRDCTSTARVGAPLATTHAQSPHTRRDLSHGGVYMDRHLCYNVTLADLGSADSWEREHADSSLRNIFALPTRTDLWTAFKDPPRPSTVSFHARMDAFRAVWAVEADQKSSVSNLTQGHPQSGLPPKIGDMKPRGRHLGESAEECSAGRQPAKPTRRRTCSCEP